MLVSGVAKLKTPFRAVMDTGIVIFWHWRAAARPAMAAIKVEVYNILAWFYS